MSLNNSNKRSLFEMKHQNRYAQLVEAQSPEPEELASSDVEACALTSDCSLGLPDNLATSAAAANLAPPTNDSDDSKQINSSHSSQQDNHHQQQPSAAPETVLDLQDFQAAPGNLLAAAAQQVDVCSSAPTVVPDRKPSRCDSSQMSTSFVSTTDSGTSTSQRRNFVIDGLRQFSLNDPQSIQQQSGDKKLDSPSSSSDSSVSFSSAARASNSFTSEKNLKRTISRSMLKLDQSVRSDKFEVKWSNLSFSYQSSKLAAAFKRKRPVKPVLCDISGSFESNQLVAIIGPSGCGKTTLLQFLAGDTPSSRHELIISGLDEPKVAFIGQDDCLLPGLTPRETLIYASRLQNSKDKKFNHEEHVKPIITELGLSECADRAVTKLSGGQAKRVTIAQELLYPKNLLFLDEVTSGLDVSTSYSIVKLLKRLVSDLEYPMSIVMSIHQPSAKLFSIFDRVYVMSEGCCLYEGSCEVYQVNAYLQGFGLECPKFHNIADYLIEIASDDLSNTSDLSAKERIIQMQRKRHQMHKARGSGVGGRGEAEENGVDVSRRSIALTTVSSVIYDPSATNGESAAVKLRDIDCEKSQQVPLVQDCVPAASIVDGLYNSIDRARRKRERPFWKHLGVHLSRSTLRIRRSYILTYLQLISYVFLGLQLATFYGPSVGSVSGCPSLPISLINFLLSNDTNEDKISSDMRRIQENMNFLLVATMTATFAALEITVITFPMEAKTVKREWRNGWYQVTSYFMGRTLADLPFQLTFVILFCAIIYSLTDQIGLTTWRFGSFVLIIIMTALIAQTVGFIFGAIFMDNLPAAVFTAPLFVFPALLFSGFFSRVSQVPSFYKPMTYFSHFRYAFDSLLVTLYGYDRCQCNEMALANYHQNSKNQTGTIREMFKSLFVTDCGTGSGGVSGSPDENSIEDSVLRSQEDSTSAMILNRITTTALPKLIASKTIDKSIEDALVDSVFEHMNKTTNTETTTEVAASGAMDHLLNKFSTRTTTILSSRSNYGHPMPFRCEEFNSYLITEFDLHNDDLMLGLIMLFVVVVISRIICNIILNFTIATRTTN